MIRLSRHQLFSLMFIFEVGSTTLFALGIKAKQDAWIVILGALLVGIGLVWIYTELQNAFPNKNYVEIIITILGKTLGMPLGLLYAMEWSWHAARNLREFGEMIKITALPETPLVFILSIFTLMSIYCLSKGVEVLARTSEIMLPLIIAFIVSTYVMIYISGSINIKNLTPVLGSGIGLILKNIPSISVFPFGEMNVFLMYWCYANNSKYIRKTAMWAVISSGLLLCISVIIDIAVLGVKYTSLATIPFLETIRVINIGSIITNVDVIGVMIIFFGGFFKMSLYYYGIVSALVTVFKMKNIKMTVIFFGIYLLWFSIIFEPSYAYHLWMFPFDTEYFVIVFTNILPLLLLIIFRLKKKRASL